MVATFGHNVSAKNVVESSVVPTVTGGTPSSAYGLTLRRTDTNCDLLVIVTTDGTGAGSGPAVTFGKGAPVSTYIGRAGGAPVATTTA
jgi:hypothetical protein